MPRGKRSTSESSNAPETEAFADGEVKTKTGAAKVTLVKPVQTDGKMAADEVKTADVAEGATEKEPAAAVEKPKQATRPKVGRSSSARKKKGDDTGAKEKKESKPRKKKDSVPKAEEPAKAETTPAEVVAESVAKTETPAPAEPEKTAAAPEAAKLPEPPATPIESKEPVALTPSAPVLAERLPGEEQMELPIDWNPDQQYRPHSFKFILTCVTLFIMVNLVIMWVFNHVHKGHATAPVTANGAPSIPALPAIAPVSSAPSEAARSLPVIPPAGSSSGEASMPSAPPAEKPTPEVMDSNSFNVSPLPRAVPPAPAEASATLPAPPVPITPENQATSAPVTPVSVSPVPEAAPEAAVPPPAPAEHEAPAPAPVEHEAAVSAPSSSAPTPVTPMPAGGGPDAAAAKAANSQELLSILDKN